MLEAAPVHGEAREWDLEQQRQQFGMGKARLATAGLPVADAGALNAQDLADVALAESEGDSTATHELFGCFHRPEIVAYYHDSSKPKCLDPRG
jgi:RecA/RadA recombinase